MPAQALRLVAIGGGELRTGETLPFDREIVAFTGAPRPRALFIPTASQDAPGYCQTFARVYGEQLGCATDVLRLVADPPTTAVARELIAGADLIYVGGGNTRRMLETWRRAGTDLLLREAAAQGTVLCGLSAGALCWFRYGNSDAPLLEGDATRRTMRIDGLGLVDAALCPHLTSEAFRRDEFSAMMADTPTVGIGLEDHGALQVHGDRYRLLATRDGACAQRFARRGGEVRSDPLFAAAAYRPLSDLLAGGR
jgi:dipeptidase E